MRAKWSALSALGLLVLPLAFPAPAAEVDVVGLYHEPDKVTKNDEVIVYLEVDDSSNISVVYLVFCIIDPPVCSQAFRMTYQGDNTYSYKIGKFKEGQDVKYNITIETKDGNRTLNAENHFAVVPAGTDGGNGNQNNTTDGTDGTGGKDDPSRMYMVYVVAGVVVIVAVAASALVIVRRRRKGA
ncbi:MAG: hypothetical protein FJ149_07695 [Euryarchaeota archaeon]|nr:hypothetical protein [Euryarchaeota archaeon]